MIKNAGTRGLLLQWKKKTSLFMTSITQTFLNSKFEIAYFKAGGRMGVEEGKSKKTIGSGVGLRALGNSFAELSLKFSSWEMMLC